MPTHDRYSANGPTRADLDASTAPTVLEFGTDWCVHCQGAQPLIKEAFAGTPEIRHLKIEDGPGSPLGRSFKVKLWPTLIFLRNGQEVDRVVRPSSTGLLRQALDKIVKSGSDPV